MQIKLSDPFSLAGKKVWVAGHTGMVGSATVRRLEQENCDVLTADHAALELRDQAAVSAWITAHKPDVVVLAAATVGGILANSTRPAEFIYDNLAIETSIIHASHQNNVEKLLFLGSACIYPREAAQPMNEEALLTGPLEPTNEWYAIAKIAGIKLCEAYRKQYGCDYISAQPNNLYGPGDNFDLQSSHVIPALMVKAHNAKLAEATSMELWGTGSPMREFAGAIAGAVGFSGDLAFDTSKPDGAPRKLLDASRMQALDWHSSITLPDGLASTYDWYLKNVAGAQTA